MLALSYFGAAKQYLIPIPDLGAAQQQKQLNQQQISEQAQQPAAEQGSTSHLRWTWQQQQQEAVGLPGRAL